ncbi:hypothetical protein P7C73_g1620, partial [Tremellales sp. Uapishka_1]
MEPDLRSISIDVMPKIKPLKIDEMFTNATRWSSSTPVVMHRPPSPPRKPRILPLPNPLRDADQGVSPLAGLFEHHELLPLVMVHFEHPRELASLARVNKAFCEYAQKKLYQNIWVRPWEEGCRLKVRDAGYSSLIKRLGQSAPSSGSVVVLIPALEVRFFPFGTSEQKQQELEKNIQTAFKHMQNLEHLVWTVRGFVAKIADPVLTRYIQRDKSLTDSIVELISALPKLHHLEISGRSDRHFDPYLLAQMKTLKDLRIMMPDHTFRDALSSITSELSRRPQGGLRGLALVSQKSPLITDAVLMALAPHLHQLKRFTLWGATRATQDGVIAVLRHARHLEDLSVDDSYHTGMKDLSLAPILPCLHTFSLSFRLEARTPARPDVSMPCLPPGIEGLRCLHLTAQNGPQEISIDSLHDLDKQINLTTLRKISLLNLDMSQATLACLMQKTPRLEELYISVQERSVVFDCKALRGSTLRILNINSPDVAPPSMGDLVALAKRMPALEELGHGNRVYEVHRHFEDEESVVELFRWSKPSIPGYFQIWR